MASIDKRPNGTWRARYRPSPRSAQLTRSFARKIDAQRWLDEITASVLTTGQYIDARTARMTVGEWCDTWLAGYGTRRPRTVIQAKVHISQIKTAFGTVPLSAVRPSTVRAWWPG